MNMFTDKYFLKGIEFCFLECDMMGGGGKCFVIKYQSTQNP